MEPDLAILCDRLEALGTRGRKGTGNLAALLDKRRGRTRFGDSKPQRLLQRIIDEWGLPPAEIECPIRLLDGRLRSIDAFYRRQGLAIEVDTYTYHSSLGAWERDHTRNNGLIELGLTVLPVTPQQLREDPAGVARLIAATLTAFERSA